MHLLSIDCYVSSPESTLTKIWFSIYAQHRGEWLEKKNIISLFILREKERGWGVGPRKRIDLLVLSRALLSTEKQIKQKSCKRGSWNPKVACFCLKEISHNAAEKTREHSRRKREIYRLLEAVDRETDKFSLSSVRYYLLGKDHKLKKPVRMILKNTIFSAQNSLNFVQ